MIGNSVNSVNGALNFKYVFLTNFTLQLIYSSDSELFFSLKIRKQ